MGRQEQVGNEIDNPNTQHDHKAVANLPLLRDLSCNPAADPGTQHDPADGDQETPKKLLWQQVQMFAQENWRTQNIQKHPIERNATGQCQK